MHPQRGPDSRSYKIRPLDRSGRLEAQTRIRDVWTGGGPALAEAYRAAHSAVLEGMWGGSVDF